MELKNTNGEMKKEKDRSLLYYSIFAACLALIIIISYAVDNDAWFIIDTGKYIVVNGFPEYDPFVLHEGFRFVSQQWLFCVCSYVVYQYFGMAGLFAFTGILCIAVVFVVLKICELVNKNKLICMLICWFFALFLIRGFCSLRPRMISGLILAVELYYLEKYAQTKKAGYLIALPILSVLMANFHSSMWLMLFVFMLPYLVNSFSFNFLSIPSSGYKKMPLLLAIIGMILFGFINPYGYKAMVYVLSIYGVSEINIISEMLPTTFSTLDGKLMFVLFFVVLCIGFGRYKKIQVRFILLSLGTMVLSLMYVRGVLFFLICATPSIAAALDGVENEINFTKASKEDKPKGFLEKNKKLKYGLYGVAIVFVVGYLSVNAYGNAKKVLNYDDARNGCVAYLKETTVPEDIALYTGFDDGDYLEFCGFYPYIDPRAEVFLKAINGQKDVFKEYTDLQNGKIYYKDFIAIYDFTHFLVRKDDALFVLLENDEDYKLTYSDDTYYIFEKND